MKYYWCHPESDCVGFEDTREEMDKVLNRDSCVVELDKDEYEKLKEKYEKDLDNKKLDK